MIPSATSIFHISNPYRNESWKTDFRLAQQTWLQLATTPFHELTADSSLGMLVTSAQLAQQSPVNTVFLYALVFAGDAMLLLPKHTATTEVLTVPHQGLTVFPGEPGTETSVRSALSHFLQYELGVRCDTDSAYLMKTILPMLGGPIVAVVVRFETEKRSHAVTGMLPIGKWFTRHQLAQFEEQAVHPEGMKQLIEEAFAQRDFEAEVVDKRDLSTRVVR